jgi:hypothetical protein
MVWLGSWLSPGVHMSITSMSSLDYPSPVGLDLRPPELFRGGLHPLPVPAADRLHDGSDGQVECAVHGAPGLRVRP